MGVIYRALHRPLKRIVALKTILSGQLASEEEVRRFRAEAEAAASLEHPNIVPVYEVGVVDGQHYFAMGYVDGPNLREKLPDAPLSARDAASLVQTLARAVAYAHDRNIIHRDLKPTNILVDAEGVPRISDFGLAKRVDVDRSITAQGQVIGTPSYMSPEQAEGQTSQIGVSSDVYALGAILYCTLTGRPPFQSADVVETLRQVRDDDPVSVRQLNPSVDRDLETICLKCLEKSPSARYESARSLGDDLDRYLTGQPILARPVGRVARMLRWSRRNRLATAVIGLAAILAIGSPIAAYREWRLHKLADKEKTIAQRAEEKADREAATAVRERNLARKQLTGHRVALRGYIGVLTNDELLREPRFAPLKKRLLKNSQRHYEEFVEQYGDEPTLRAEVGDALIRLAQIASETGAAQQQSVDLLLKAESLIEPLARAEPANETHRGRLAFAYSLLSKIYLDTGRPKKALAAIQNAKRLQAQLVKQAPTNLRHQLDLAGILSQTANTHREKDEAKEATQAINLALAILDGIPRQSGAHRRRIAATYDDLAGLLRRREMTVESARAYEKAQFLWECLACEFPTDPWIRSLLAINYDNSAAQHDDVGKVQLADEQRRRSHPLWVQLVRDFATDPRYRSGMAASHFRRARQFRDRSDRKRASAEFQRSLGLWQSLVRENPAMAEYRWQLALASREFAAVCFEISQFDESKRRNALAMGHLEMLAREVPEIPKYRQELAESCQLAGQLDRVAGNLKSALANGQRAVAIQAKLVAAHPDIPEYKNRLGTYHHNYGVIWEAAADPRQALGEYREAVKLLQPLVRAYPEVTLHRRELAASLNSLAILAASHGDKREAQKTYQEASRHLERLAREQPGHAEFRVMLAGCHFNLGRLLWQLGDPKSALMHSETALALRKALAKQNPETPGFRNDLADAHKQLAILHSTNLRLSDASDSLAECLTIRKRLVSRHPKDSAFESSLADDYFTLGNHLRRLRKRSESQQSYSKAAEIWTRLAADQPTVPEFRRKLGGVFYNRAALFLELRDPSTAATDYGKAIALQEKLVRAHPDSAPDQDRLASSYNNLGLLQMRVLRADTGAVRSFIRCVEIRQTLKKKHPELEENTVKLAGSLENLALSYVRVNKTAKAIEAAKKSLQLNTKLLDAAPMREDRRIAVGSSALINANLIREANPKSAIEFLDKSIQQLSPVVRASPTNIRARSYLYGAFMLRATAYDQVFEFRKAAFDWDKALRYAPTARKFAMAMNLAQSFARSGQFTHATALARQLSLRARTSETLYRIAGVYAASATAVRRNARLDDRQRERLAEDFASRSIAMLRRADSAGYFGGLTGVSKRRRFVNEPDFRGLRSHPQFRKLATELKIHLPVDAPRPDVAAVNIP